MYLIVAFLSEVFAFLMLIAAGFAGFFTYQEYEKLPQEVREGSLLTMVQDTQKIQLGLGVVGGALVLFVLFMLVHAVIDTARNSRKILARLEQSQS